MLRHLRIFFFALAFVAFPLVSQAASCPYLTTQTLSGTAVTTTGANVRSLGCVDGTILSVLPVNATVTLIGSAGSWDAVRTADGKTGWVAGWLLRPTSGSSDGSGPNVADASTTPTPSGNASGAATSTISVSPSQYGTIPSNIDAVALNRYWLGKINALRQAKGLRLLALDERLVNTASVWAGVMAARGYASHTRPKGQTVNQWAAAQGLDFTKRYSPGGWTKNFFTENIAWNYTDGTMAGAEHALDETLAWFVAEGPSGSHYQTVYFPDWNSVGAGFAFVHNGTHLEIYQAYHYSSLVGVITPH